VLYSNDNWLTLRLVHCLPMAAELYLPNSLLMTVELHLIQ